MHNLFYEFSRTLRRLAGLAPVLLISPGSRPCLRHNNVLLTQLALPRTDN